MRAWTSDNGVRGARGTVLESEGGGKPKSVARTSSWQNDPSRVIPDYLAVYPRAVEERFWAYCGVELYN